MGMEERIGLGAPNLEAEILMKEVVAGGKPHEITGSSSEMVKAIRIQILVARTGKRGRWKLTMMRMHEDTDTIAEC